jgi:hypothetical protein
MKARCTGPPKHKLLVFFWPLFFFKYFHQFCIKTSWLKMFLGYYFIKCRSIFNLFSNKIITCVFLYNISKHFLILYSLSWYFFLKKNFNLMAFLCVFFFFILIQLNKNCLKNKVTKPNRIYDLSRGFDELTYIDSKHRGLININWE